MSAVVGASSEVIAEHADRHCRRCSGAGYRAPCPCGDAIVIVCEECGPVFIALRPGTFCRHAGEVLELGERAR